MTTTTTAVIRCAVPGCDGRLRVDIRHLANLLAAHWTCPLDHREDTP